MVNTGNNSSKYASHGGASSFGSLIKALGGNKGKFSFIRNDEGGVDETIVEGGEGGSPNGMKGLAVSKGGKVDGIGGFLLSFSLSNGEYGKGGGADAVRPSFGGWGCAIVGGGSGGYNSGYVEVVPGSTYSITVGSGGSSATNWHSSIAEQGTHGFVLIAFVSDI